MYHNYKSRRSKKGEEGKKGKNSGILAFLPLFESLANCLLALVAVARVAYSRLMTALQARVNNSRHSILLIALKTRFFSVFLAIEGQRLEYRLAAGLARTTYTDWIPNTAGRKPAL